MWHFVNQTITLRTFHGLDWTHKDKHKDKDKAFKDTHTHTRLTALFQGLPRVSRYQKGKTNLDFTEARDSE